MEIAGERIVPNDVIDDSAFGHSQVTEADIENMWEENLADTMVRLIHHNRAVQKALLDFAMACPNIRTRV